VNLETDMPSGAQALMRTPEGWSGGADPRREGLQLGLLHVAQPLLRDRAAGVEVAARRRADRARHVALQHDALALDRRVGDRHRRQQGLGVGVQRVAVQVLAGAISTMRPRYITATRSLMCSTTLRSCAMKM
jgi:hypothetical protein